MTVHIIGEGERREELVQAIRDAGAQAEFHGAIYDEAEKHRILTRCRFGLNLMRDSVCIGLTMKSVDYWKHDLRSSTTSPPTRPALSRRSVSA